MNDDHKSQSTVCSEKNCQESQNVNMWPVKPPMNMQLSKPTRKQANHKKCEFIKCLCDDRNCQSDNNMCSDKNQVKHVCYDRNCQSTQ